MILSINFAPEPISTAAYTTGLAEWLAGRGHEIQGLSAQPYYPDWKVFDGYPKAWYRHEELAPNLSVTHCPTYVPRQPTGVRRIFHSLSFVLSAFPLALWSSLAWRPDVVLVVVPSMIYAPLGWLAAKLARGMLWMHIQDFEIDVAVHTNLMSKARWLTRVARGFERWCLRRCDLATTICAPMLAKLGEKGAPESHMREMRNWAYLDRITLDGDPSVFREKLGIKTRFVALYAGTVAQKQGLEVIPKAARLVLNRSDVTFVIAGQGPALSRIQAEAQGLPNVLFTKLEHLDALNDLLAMADVHLLPQVAGVADAVLPSKLTNMLASGRPVVACAAPGTALAHEVDGVGLSVPPESPGDLAKAVMVLVADDDLRQALGAAGRARALSHWNRDTILPPIEADVVNLIRRAGR